jgi:hypothetical protein
MIWLLDSAVRRGILMPAAWCVALASIGMVVAPIFLSARRLELEHCVVLAGNFYRGPLSFSSCDAWQVILASQLDHPSAGATILLTGLSMVFLALGVRVGGKTAFFVTPASVLLLRTFAGDERAADAVTEGVKAPIEALSWFERIANWITAKRPSREFAEKLERLGPVVLLPRPRQILRDLGGGSELVLSDDWQHEIELAFRACKWIVAAVGDEWGLGFEWELVSVQRLACEHKFLMRVNSRSGWDQLQKIPWLAAKLADVPADAWRVAPIVRIASANGQVLLYRTFKDVQDDVAVPREKLNPPATPKLELSRKQRAERFSNMKDKPRGRR